MDDNRGNKKLLRAEGRIQACEGILRSQFGRRGSTAGSRALRTLRMQEKVALRGLWLRYAGAAAAAAVVLVIILIYAFTGPDKPEQSSPSENQALKRVERQRGRNIPRKTVPAGDAQQDKFVEKQKPSEETREKEPAPAPEREKSIVLAQIGELSGDVKVKRKDTEEWLETGILFNILPGDTVKASSPGQARLDLEGGDSLYLNSDAEVMVGKETDEVLFMLELGEIYIEKESTDGAVAVDTGYGRIRSRKGRFHLKRLNRDECLLHVIEGEVECLEKSGNHSHKYKDRMQARFRRGEHCEEGRKFDSEEGFKWAMRMRSRRRPPHRGKGRGPGMHGRGPFPGDGRFGPGKGSPSRFFRKLVEDFDEFDADGDGRLTPEEMKVPDKEMGRKLLEPFDTDADGGLSLEECKAILEKMKDRKGPPGSGRHGPGGTRGGQKDPDNDE